MTDLRTTMALVRAAVDARLARTEELLGGAALPAEAEALVGAGSDLLGGGKRMRAVLGAIGLALVGERAGDHRVDDATAAHLGAALELYQASALVHDDVIDGATTRRGLPAAHKRFESEHAAALWRGPSAAYGVNAAILLGDLLLSAAGREMGRAAGAAAGVGTPEAAARAAHDAFDAMTAEVAVGQFLDVRNEVLPLPGPQDPDEAAAQAAEAMLGSALEVVRRKSARYSVRQPLLIGALLSGTDLGSPVAQALSVFGEETGIAFQLRDDDLGVFGDPAVTGKPAGEDLREGKRTVLLALAWARVGADGRGLLAEVLANPSAAPEAIAAASAVIESSGARAAHELVIAEHTRAGLEALEEAARAGLAPEAQAVLAELSEALTSRAA